MSWRVVLTAVAIAAALVLTWIVGTGHDAPVSTPRIETAPTEAPAPSVLPREVRDTLSRIAAGGPFRYRQDGGVFGNYEGKLPKRARGYYREYTVETPGSSDRGARRIVTGGDPPVEYFYTADHYQSFRPIEGSR